LRSSRALCSYAGEPWKFCGKSITGEIIPHFILARAARSAMSR
jgi:hypothetical protein